MKEWAIMSIFRIRATLLEIQPPVWRSIELSDQTTLKQLHRILQIAMGWEDCHLHEFVIRGQRYGKRDPDFDSAESILPETGVSLADVLQKPKSQITYIYDLGDYWQHSVRLEAIGVADSETQYPRVVDGVRACPPEDCGGTSGYMDLLKILGDPSHEEFENMREWADPKFNAEAFSLDAVNTRLRRNRSLAVRE